MEPEWDYFPTERARGPERILEPPWTVGFRARRETPHHDGEPLSESGGFLSLPHGPWAWALWEHDGRMELTETNPRQKPELLVEQRDPALGHRGPHV